MTHLKVAAFVAAPLLLAVVACSGDSDSTATGTTESTPSAQQDSDSSPTPTATEEPDPEPDARVGDCFDTKLVFEYTNVPDPIECTQGEYTQTTLAVFSIDEDPPVTYPEIQALTEQGAYVDRSDADKQLTDEFREWSRPLYSECSALVRETIGADPYRNTLFFGDLTGPNQEQWDEGQRWARCNIGLRDPKSLSEERATLTPLGKVLDNNHKAYQHQVCFDYGDDGAKRYDSCDTRRFKNDGAWMVLLSNIPITDVAPEYPGSKQASADALMDYCMSESRPYAKSGTLDQDNVRWEYRIPVWKKDRDSNFKDAWASPGTVVSCWIPNWAYSNAP